MAEFVRLGVYTASLDVSGVTEVSEPLWHCDWLDLGISGFIEALEPLYSCRTLYYYKLTTAVDFNMSCKL